MKVKYEDLFGVVAEFDGWSRSDLAKALRKLRTKYGTAKRVYSRRGPGHGWCFLGMFNRLAVTTT